MARAFHRRGRGPGLRFAARLDAAERRIVAGVMREVLDLIGGPVAVAADPTDEFDAIVAGLGVDFGGPARDADADDGLGGRGFGGERRDPALDRLFPSGNRVDEHAASEFRRLTEATLRERKATNLQTAIDALDGAVDDRVELTEQTALAVLVALTDVRLVLGDRLGLRADADAQRLDEVLATLDEDDPAGAAIVLYDFLTWLQETLATAMLPRTGR